jgi:hypothetical protein
VPHPSVILTKVRIQSHKRHPPLSWILTFVRMTERLFLPPPPNHLPGAGRGPIGRTWLVKATLRHCDLSNWTPASAGEVRAAEPKYPSFRRGDE